MNRPGLKAALALKFTVSVGLLWVLFSRADVGSTFSRFRQMNMYWMTAALGTYGLMLLVSAWRWRLLLQVQTVDVSLTTLTKSFLVATFFNNFLPSNIGGDVVRVADTAPFAGSKTLATTVVLLDRILGLVALLAVAAIASALAASVGIRLWGMGYVWLALVGLGAGLFLFLKFPDTFSRALRAAGRGPGGRPADAPPQSGRRPSNALPASRGPCGSRLPAPSRFRRSSSSFTCARRGACRCRSHCSRRPSSYRSAWPSRWPRFDQRLWRPRGGVCFLLHESWVRRQLGSHAVSRQRRADHALLLERRRSVPAQIP